MSRERLLRMQGAYRWIEKFRPASLRHLLVKAFGPSERRGIVGCDGLRFYVDPFSFFGRCVLDGSYEPETADVFRRHIGSGDSVLDVGANEGFFTCLASRLAGPQGCVVAVEPQSRLIDVLRINTLLNPASTVHIVNAAVDERSGGTATLFLHPLNTGASSIVRRYPWGREAETVGTVAAQELLALSGRDRFDFVKVDVEGFEPEVVRSLLPLLEEGRIGRLLVDYHQPILRERGVDPRRTHDLILSCGYEADGGDADFCGYALYVRRADAPRDREAATPLRAISPA